MSYDFSFDKKSAILIIAGCAAIGALLFFAGFILGLDHGQAEAKTAAPVGRAAAAVPAPKASGSSNSKPKSDSDTPSLTSSNQNSNKPGAPAPKPEESSKSASAPPAAAAKGPIAGEKTETASKTEAESPDAAEDQTGFCLQLGAFKTEENAQRLMASMKTRGYTVFLYKALDTNNHVWHTVRMGPYPDVKKAAQAAQEFSRKEQIPAFVRPRNEL
jgi:cell division septation protein DedD